jgi:hypothetical protein
MHASTHLRFTVRAQSSRDGSTKFYVYDTRRKGRVSAHTATHRDTAQHEADELNIAELVPDFVVDPRPYNERLADARRVFLSGAPDRLINIL